MLQTRKCDSNHILTHQVYFVCFPHVTIMTVYWVQVLNTAYSKDVQGGTVGLQLILQRLLQTVGRNLWLGGHR